MKMPHVLVLALAVFIVIVITKRVTFLRDMIYQTSVITTGKDGGVDKSPITGDDLRNGNYFSRS